MNPESDMSQAGTEMMSIPLKADIDITAGASKNALEEAICIVAEQPGCSSIYWGLQIENPKILHMVITWEKIQDSYNFMSLPSYNKIFLERLDMFLSGTVSFFHVQLPSDEPFTDAVSAPVTECITVSFDPDYPNSAFDASWAKFKEAGKALAKGLHALVGGWVVEELKNEKVDGGMSKTFFTFNGWSSLEAHTSFAQSEDFPEVVRHVKDGPKTIIIYHTALKKVKG